MSYQRTEIPESDIQRQLDICAQLRAHFSAGGRQPLAPHGCADIILFIPGKAAARQ